MFIKNIVKSSPMPPRKDKELQPHLEKRRIVGSLRERTVYLQSPPNSQNYQQEDRIVESRKSALFDQLLNDLAKRISDHVERELTVQQITIDQKIEEIDEHARTNLMIHETLENRLKKLRKKLKYKNHTHSQPITSCRSGIAIYNHSINKFISKTSDDSSEYSDEEIESKQQEIDSFKHRNSHENYDGSFFTTLW